MSHDRNPYDWTSSTPSHEVPRRALLNEVAGAIRNGKPGYLIGCRGMGKSVFLGQLQAELANDPELDLLLFHRPRPAETDRLDLAIRSIADAMKKQLTARVSDPHTVISRLGEYARQRRLDDLFETYLDTVEEVGVERLVLLYDEFDAYANPVSFGRELFNTLEDVRKRSHGRLVIFAAGGLSLVTLDSIFGSPFFVRPTPNILAPFTYAQLEELAAPFANRGAPLSHEVLHALEQMSGGNVMLATFGLEKLWAIDSPEPGHVAGIFNEFIDDQSTALNSILRPALEGPFGRVLRGLQSAAGNLRAQELRQLAAPLTGESSIDPVHIFHMLRSSGMIRADKSAHRQDPIQVDIIPSILTLRLDDPAVKDSLREQLLVDLGDALAQLHRMAVSYFRSDEKDKKQLVPEAVFSATIAIALHSRGWHTEVEAVSAAGRTDIKARLPRFGQRAVIIEVKIWGRGHKKIQAQVESYWSADVDALATVTITDNAKPGWPAEFAQQCLADHNIPYKAKTPSPSALAGYYVADTASPDCAVAKVDHFLLRLKRRDR